jgi:hypothetical protein
MTERGLPISDGAPACPFVAFADDRDERATSPDHRHRCYAEAQPAPRALAHQEAYCLSSAFPVCPTFQDWARREAARARESTIAGTASAEADHDRTPLPQRNPPRDWAAPPPWLSDEDGNPDEAGEVRPVSARGGGLAGSYADRVASGDAVPDRQAPEAAPIAAPERGPAQPPARSPVPGAAQPASPPPAAAGVDDERASPRRVSPGPEWEQPRRLDEFPEIRSRRLGEWSISPILIAFVALLLAATVLFALPGLLGFGGPGGPAGSATPGTPIETVLPSLEPTPVPEPTATIYVVQQGDTMSKIANKFGIPLQTLIDANAENIPDPDRLQIGDQVIIPGAVPTEIPGEVPAGG